MILIIQLQLRCGAPDGLREVCHMAVWEKVQQIILHDLVNIFINLKTAMMMMRMDIMTMMMRTTLTKMLLKVWEDFRETQWDRSTCIRPGGNQK